MANLAHAGRQLLNLAVSQGDVVESELNEEDNYGEFDLEEDEDFEIADEGDGEGFMAVKPWIGAMVCPSEYDGVMLSSDPPAESLKLDWVFGYTKEGRSNAFALPSGEYVWPSGAVGVIYDPARNKQRFLLGHVDQIYAMAQSPADGSIIATGGKQLKRKSETPVTFVWDTNSCRTIARCRNMKIKRGISALAFSPDGNFIIAVGKSDVHNVVCYDWQRETTTSIVEGGRENILDLYISPFDGQMVTVGVKHLQFYPYRNGQVGKGKKARSIRSTVIGVTATSKGIWVGVSGGHLMLFVGGRMRTTKKNVHKGNLLALAYHETLNALVTGGSDGKVNYFDCSKGRVIHDIKVSKGAVSSLAFASNGVVVVGTRRGEVHAVDFSSSITVDTFCQSHFDGETWGLAVHPFDPYIVTSGDDNTLRYWDLNKRKLARSVELVSGNHKKTRPSRRRPARGGASTTGTFPPNKCSRAVAFDPMAEILAVGMNDGSFMILDEKSLEKIAHKRGRGLSQWVQDLKFSPLDPILAVSTHDNFIDLWEYEGSNFTMIHRLRGHNSFITHIDWSSDGANLQSNCGAYELLFWDSFEGTQVTNASSLKDTAWDTWTCTLGWPVQGIWDAEAKGCDVNCVSRSSDQKLLVCGEDSQKLKLFSFPCADGARYKEYIAHGSFVTNCRFTADDKYVVTTGGNDNSVMMWKVV